MYIYNTLSEKKEKLLKPKRGPLKLFVCGPTVYNFMHLGNARTYIVFDYIVKYLRHNGFKISYLQNITDVDDKIIERARQEKKTSQDIARHFEKEYFQDMNTLGVDAVDQYARASDFITAIYAQIKTLISKGFAYKTDSGVYFEIKKFKSYGQLSRQNIKELRAGWRIEPDPQKRDPIDFALWKNSEEEPNWPSPWGKGRPGWHIEDTAITEKIFGQQYDLHGGGLDLKFPHHESEIAQQEAASGKSPFVKIWLHTGILLIEGEKMSKSLNNFITIRNFLKNNYPLTLRFLVTSIHYRSPLNYTDSVVDQVKKTISNTVKFLTKLKMSSIRPSSSLRVTKGDMAISKKITKETEEKFNKAMDDDFNTPEALAAIFSLINKVEPLIWKIDKKEAEGVEKVIEKLFKILGLNITSYEAPENIQELAKQREFFRGKNNFAAADEIRRQIQKLGYEIEDMPAGPLVTKNLEARI